MKRIFKLLLVLFSILFVFVISSCNQISNSKKNDGTYYLYENESLNKNKYYKITSDKWSDENGDSGTYKISGTNITLYMEIFGSNDELYSGTISNGCLIISAMGANITYYKEGSEPKKNTPITTYIVTFNTNGGSNVNSQTINSGSKVTKPSNPIKDGYTFVGWYTNSELTIEFDFNTAITKNITLYAKWNDNNTPITTYTVTFNTNGGSSVNSQTINSGSKVTKPSNPTKNSYTFIGWYTNSGLTTEFDFNTAITSNVILYAKWNEIDDSNSVTLSFEVNGGSKIEAQKIKIGDSAFKPTDPTKEGYLFDGWYSDAAFNKAFNFNTIISADKTIYAKWVQDCIVTFVNYDNALLKTYHVKYGENVIYDGVSPTHKNGDYVFIGWNKNLNNITSSVTIKALFEQVLVGTNGFEYSLSSDKSYYIIESSGDINEEVVIIPYSFNGLPIREISSGALSGLTNTKKIIVQSNIELIGSEAITGCTNLEEIVLPFVGESKTTNSNILFEYIFDSVPSSLHTIRINGGEIRGTINKLSCFSNLDKTNVRNLCLSKAVYKVDEFVFDSLLEKIKLYIEDDEDKFNLNLGITTYYNVNQEKMLVNDGFTYLIENDSAIVTDYSKSSTSIIVPSTIIVDNIRYNVIQIGERAFKNCINIETIQLPQSIKLFKKEAFAYCNSLTKINMPSNLTEICNNAFEHCVKITNIQLPSLLKTIGNNVFKNCSEISSITLNSGLETIGLNAFYSCSKLTELSIPTSVYYIGSDAFYGCSKLTYNKITSGNGTGDYLGNSNNQYLWLIKASGSSTSYVMSNNTKHIYSKAFSNLQTINDMTYTLSSNLETIGYNAFDNTKFTAINIPSSVYWIDDYVFDGKDITSIALPNNLKHLGDYSFRNCTILEEIELPNELEYLGAGAFYGCTKLKDITIPDSITEINKDTFYGCTSLEDIIFNNITSIGSSAFYNCKNLENIFLDDKINEVGSNCFYDDNNLNIYIKGTEIPSGFDTNFNPSEAKIIFVDRLPARGLTVLTTVNNAKAGSVTDLSMNKFVEGDSIAITATTNPGYTFIGWYSGEELLTKDLLYTFNMPAENVIYEARYSINKYTITIDNQAEGVTISGITSGNEYVFDSQIALSATNIPLGYAIKWERSDGFIYAGDNYGFKVPLTNITITTTIVTHPYTRDGNKIYFGSYPQTIITNKELIEELNVLANSLPQSGVTYNWNQYIFNDQPSNYMYYQDIDYDNNGTYDYRGVYFTQYRPPHYFAGSSMPNSYQDDNGYTTNTIYWFSYDPIEWNILFKSSGKVLIIADLILDSRDYYPSASTSSFSHNGGSGFANNYELSNIRKWLNDTFYNTAFNDLQKSLIETTEVDNSVSSTEYSPNPFACNNINDKMFLLSYKEASAYYTSSLARVAKGTDYAKSQGLYVYTFSDFYQGNSYWWLRSPSDYHADAASIVNGEGFIGISSVNPIYYGVRPACWIAL